jgi:hypothetical protein
MKSSMSQMTNTGKFAAFARFHMTIEKKIIII